MKKGDFIIIVAVIGICLLLFLLFPFKKGKTVTVKKDNKTVYSENLNKDNNVDLGNNTVIIKSGEVYMKEANCKNQICVHTGKISKSGESIVCLPNKVVVLIK